MPERLGKETSSQTHEQMGRIMRNDIRRGLSLLSIHEHPVLPLKYAEVLADPRAAAAAIAYFLGSDLDVLAMARAVDPTLQATPASPNHASKSHPCRPAPCIRVQSWTGLIIMRRW